LVQSAESTVSRTALSHTAFIGLGSNLGDSKKLLLRAWQTLAAHPCVLADRLSSPYATRPFAMESTHWFVNAAGGLKTSLSPHELLSLLLKIEKKFGRKRDQTSTTHQDRTLDLDLLLYDERIMTTEDLILPHPEMHKRLFVLGPLAEIAPAAVHPTTGKTVAELREVLADGVKNDEIKRLKWSQKA